MSDFVPVPCCFDDDSLLVRECDTSRVVLFFFLKLELYWDFRISIYSYYNILLGFSFTHCKSLQTVTHVSNPDHNLFFSTVLKLRIFSRFKIIP